MHARVPVAVVLVIAAWCILMWMRDRKRRIGPFQCRRDHEGLWMAAFGAEDRARVETLLLAICDAFFIPSRYRFRLRPSDDIHEFYRRSTHGSLADSMEYVALMIDLEREFGLSDDTVDSVLQRRPCTVGSLARLITRPRETLGVGADSRSDGDA